MRTITMNSRWVMTMVEKQPVHHISNKDKHKLLKTADDACEQKRNKYKNVARQQHAEFIPFAIEMYGGLSNSARSLIQQIAVFAADHLSGWSKEEIVENLNSSVAIAVQRGNAFAALCGYQACAISAA